jgi:hypothetical protein
MTRCLTLSKRRQSATIIGPTSQHRIGGNAVDRNAKKQKTEKRTLNKGNDTEKCSASRRNTMV